MILEDAIKQTTFSSTELRTALNIYYTHGCLQAFSLNLLRAFDISNQQFNILRILRGQKGGVISVSEITVRMLDKMSNTSRLLEKLRQKGLVNRRECPEDRRRVEIELTEKGLQTVNEASEILDREIVDRFRMLSKDDLRNLNAILDKINSYVD